MVATIIIKDDNGNQIKKEDFYAKADRKWEETSYKVGCKVAREVAEVMLKDLDEELYQNRDKRWKSKTFSKRTYVTRFGDVVISRRLYKNKDKYLFLLDDYLGWHGYPRVTPDLKEALVELSTQCSFRRVSEIMSKLTAGVLTKSTIHNLLTITYLQKYLVRQLKEKGRSIYHVLEKANYLKGERRKPKYFIWNQMVYIFIFKERKTRKRNR